MNKIKWNQMKSIRLHSLGVTIVTKHLIRYRLQYKIYIFHLNRTRKEKNDANREFNKIGDTINFQTRNPTHSDAFQVRCCLLPICLFVATILVVLGDCEYRSSSVLCFFVVFRFIFYVCFNRVWQFCFVVVGLPLQWLKNIDFFRSRRRRWQKAIVIICFVQMKKTFFFSAAGTNEVEWSYEEWKNVKKRATTQNIKHQVTFA